MIGAVNSSPSFGALYTVTVPGETKFFGGVTRRINKALTNAGMGYKRITVRLNSKTPVLSNEIRIIKTPKIDNFAPINCRNVLIIDNLAKPDESFQRALLADFPLTKIVQPK